VSLIAFGISGIFQVVLIIDISDYGFCMSIEYSAVYLHAFDFVLLGSLDNLIPDFDISLIHEHPEYLPPSLICIYRL
jgi:hypothetical protein